MTGWTLPLQMGVDVDAVTDPLGADERALLTKIDKAELPAQSVEGAGSLFALSHRTNASFEAVNAALAAGATVQLAEDPVKTANGMERGAFLVGGIDRAKMEDLAKKYEVPAVAVSAPAHTLPIKKSARRASTVHGRPSIDEGWTRWILEIYGFAPKSLYNADIRSAALRDRYDVIVLPDMSTRQLMEGFGIGMVPGQYAGGIGQDGLDNLREFVRAGGTLVALNRTAGGAHPAALAPR